MDVLAALRIPEWMMELAEELAKGRGGRGRRRVESQRFHPRRLGSGDKTMAANRGPDICLSMPYSVSCRW